MKYLGEHVLEETLEKTDKLAYETTSSLQADLKNGRRAELESLAGYVFKTSREKGLEAPRHEELYNNLKLRLPVVLGACIPAQARRRVYINVSY